MHSWMLHGPCAGGTGDQVGLEHRPIPQALEDRHERGHIFRELALPHLKPHCAVLRGVSVCVQVLKTPAALAYHGVGPMVSARVHDLHILWNRTFQLFDLCTKVCLPDTLT